MSEGTITITLPARDARVMIHIYGYAVSKEANNVDGAKGEQLENLWDIYYSMQSQATAQRGKSA